MKLIELLQGRFMSHPLHPALVHFPIGLWSASFIFDLLSVFQADPITANYFVVTSWYCLLLGVIGALPTAVTGIAEFMTIPRSTKAQVLALTHMALNVLLIATYIAQVSLRETGDPRVSLPMIVVNGIAFMVLGISGYIGGKLAYEYRIGSRVPAETEDSQKKAA